MRENGLRNISKKPKLSCNFGEIVKGFEANGEVNGADFGVMCGVGVVRAEYQMTESAHYKEEARLERKGKLDAEVWVLASYAKQIPTAFFTGNVGIKRADREEM